jgi:hypothetical protein
VVADGFAVTFEPVDELNEEEGLQIKLVAPLAASEMLCPPHMVSSGETEING